MKLRVEIKKLAGLITQFKKIINSKKELLKVISNELKFYKRKIFNTYEEHKLLTLF